MKSNFILRQLLFLMFAILINSSALAKIKPLDSIAPVVYSADLIAIIEVTSDAHRVSLGAYAGLVHAHILDILKGSVLKKDVVIRVARSIEISDIDVYKTGGKYLSFLTYDGKYYHNVLGIWGVFALSGSNVAGWPDHLWLNNKFIDPKPFTPIEQIKKEISKILLGAYAAAKNDIYLEAIETMIYLASLHNKLRPKIYFISLGDEHNKVEEKKFLKRLWSSSIPYQPFRTAKLIHNNYVDKMSESRGIVVGVNNFKWLTKNKAQVESFYKLSRSKARHYRFQYIKYKGYWQVKSKEIL